MQLSQLEMFRAVAETGSISAAAEIVNRVPSNVTTRIRQLEAELGIALFIRENQRLRLSPAGRNFLDYNNRILDLVAEAKTAVTGKQPQGLFALGSLESTAAVRIPPLLARYHQRWPQVELALSTGPSGMMLEKVLEGALEATFVDGPILHPALEGIPVFREEMVLVASRDHAPVNRAGDVSGENLFAFRDNCSYRRHFESWFRDDGAMPGKIYPVESYHGMLACVTAGSGLALMPRSMLESMPGSGTVSIWPLAEHYRYLDTWLVWRRGPQSVNLQEFIALCQPESGAVPLASPR